MDLVRARGAGGVSLALHEFGGHGPICLYVHGTSFNATMLAPLAHAVGRARAVGLDLPGHGASGRPPDPGTIFGGLGADVLGALDALCDAQPGPVFGVGHSAGATALLLAAAARPGAFTALYCYEPIVLDDEIRALAPLPTALLRAARRRAAFASRSDARAYFAARDPLSGLHPEVLAAYIEDGLVEDPNGGVRLACDPSVEAEMYLAGFRVDLGPVIAGASCPVRVAYGGESDVLGPLAAKHVAALLPEADLVVVEGLTHLGPLEDPARVAVSIIPVVDTPAA